MTTVDEVGAGEAFLRKCHNQLPGAMGRYVAANPLPDGRTSYELLAEQVAGAERVLDLGCGDGSLLAVLAHDGAIGLAGIDLSAGELALARTRPELADAELHEGRAQRLPFADDSFDAVVSHMALMLMSDVEQVVAETARVLEPAGLLAIVVGGRPTPGSGLELFLKLARPIFAAAQDAVPPLGDRRTRTREGLNELLTPAGFEPIAWTEIAPAVHATPEQIWESALEKYYDVLTLDAGQLRGLREEFVTRASALAAGQQLVRGDRMSLATSRYRPEQRGSAGDGPQRRAGGQ
ncbi:class I SAM-dependent methyltransferase [Nocardia abscessus]|uniref:class I SAM-dependent methyltransferase n=1 Tax=Nocardia abscessus TaxID=120957 RepID=UPI002455DA7F|nr:class I SAM-dependent methyltransferase [Nocardia abscessus]